tara:strand:- start:3893 stop:4102 length:210 start_codon:yes stop_codon:yes gene_type:complete
MFKVLENFGCNGVKKTKGQTIDNDEIIIIGNLIHELIEGDIVEEIPVDPQPDPQPIIKQRKKRGPKKKV